MESVQQYCNECLNKLKELKEKRDEKGGTEFIIKYKEFENYLHERKSQTNSNDEIYWILLNAEFKLIRMFV